MGLRDELLATEQQIKDNLQQVSEHIWKLLAKPFWQLMEEALVKGTAKLQAAIEAAKRKGKRLADAVRAAQQRIADLELGEMDWCALEVSSCWGCRMAAYVFHYEGELGSCQEGCGGEGYGRGEDCWYGLKGGA